MPSNAAAWLRAWKSPLEVGPAPYTHPAADEIVVKNRALAINPLDWILQVAGNIAYRWIKPPFILGTDVSGEVAEVGTGVTRFKVGDRVLGMAVGTDKDSNSCARGAFQEYTVVFERMAAPIPDTMSYENAVVLPLAVSTASCGLFQKDHLALQHPSANPAPTGRTVLVWGGSTSVGSNAIQLAVAAGYEVVTTASPRNFGYVQKLGASQVFDYHSPTVVKDIIQALDGKTLAGAIAIGQGSAGFCADILPACSGSKFISTASGPAFEKLATGRRGRFQLPRTLLTFVSSNVSLQVKCRRRGIRTKFMFGSTLKNNEVSKAIYEDFLPSALAEGRFVAAPDPLVAGTGLQDVQAGLDTQLRGVSARKVVISL
jgi:NADPH:quinone reductase-like Zn-dependent oxidoreductase